MNNSTPSFYVYKPNGDKVDTLKKSFLKKRTIHPYEYATGVLTAYDEHWTLVVEPASKHIFAKEEAAYCIISFQVHSHGNFAIARIYDKEKEQANV